MNKTTQALLLRADKAFNNDNYLLALNFYRQAQDSLDEKSAKHDDNKVHIEVEILITQTIITLGKKLSLKKAEQLFSQYHWQVYDLATINPDSKANFTLAWKTVAELAEQISDSHYDNKDIYSAYHWIQQTIDCYDRAEITLPIKTRLGFLYLLEKICRKTQNNNNYLQKMNKYLLPLRQIIGHKNKKEMQSYHHFINDQLQGPIQKKSRKRQRARQTAINIHFVHKQSDRSSSTQLPVMVDDTHTASNSSQASPTRFFVVQGRPPAQLPTQVNKQVRFNLPSPSARYKPTPPTKKQRTHQNSSVSPPEETLFFLCDLFNTPEPPPTVALAYSNASTQQFCSIFKRLCPGGSQRPAPFFSNALHHLATVIYRQLKNSPLFTTRSEFSIKHHDMLRHALRFYPATKTQDELDKVNQQRGLAQRYHITSNDFPFINDGFYYQHATNVLTDLINEFGEHLENNAQLTPLIVKLHQHWVESLYAGRLINKEQLYQLLPQGEPSSQKELAPPR